MYLHGRTQWFIVIVLFVACTAVAVVGLRALVAAVAKDFQEQNDATQEIASAVAESLDRGWEGGLDQVVGPVMSRHPRVRAVQLVCKNREAPLEFGALDELHTKMAEKAPDVHRVNFIREGQPWGTVHVLLGPATDTSMFHPGSVQFSIVLGASVFLLPLAVTALERLRRRLDRSPTGAMAVAAERSRHTLDTLAEGVLLLDERGHIIFANEAIKATFTSALKIGAHVGELPWTPLQESGPTNRHPWDQSIDLGIPVRGFRLGVRLEAHEALFIVNCTPIFRERRHLHGVLVTFDDVTELEQHRLALEEARDAAQHANQAKSQFLAMMSHEIRTPLNGVCGSLQLLKKTTLQDRQTQYVQAAGFSASTLLHLINDILDFSKIEAGQLELSPVEFDLAACVDDTMLMMVQAARTKHLTLAYDIGVGVASRFVADPDRIRQIIINLVNNAIKFTERGSVTLSVTLERELPETQTLRCEVSDTGIGIPAEKMPRLFKAFSQVDSSTSRRFGGTGLGLIISKQLCEMMGGRIDVSSIEGKGTTFTFLLDLPKAGNMPTSSAVASPIHTAVLVGLHHLETRVVRRLLALPENQVVECADHDQLATWIHSVQSSEIDGVVLAIVGGSNVADVQPLIHALRKAPFAHQLRIVAAVYGPEDPSPHDAAVDQVLRRPIGAARLLQAIQPASAGGDTGSEGRADQVRHRAIDLTGLTILVAEDNPVGMMVVTDMLRDAGAECDSAGDGNQVLAAVQRKRYDVVLMDCFMPELDGFEATRRIRELEQCSNSSPRLPIIALTAKAMRGDREACLKAGMDGYITKPVDEEQLLRTVIEHSGRQIRTERSSTAAPNLDAPRLNVQALRERFANKEALLSNLVRTFRETATEDVGRIESALREHDARALEHAAHRLAGGAGFMSADRIRQLAMDLEQHGVDRQLDGLAVIADRLRQELATVIKDLEQMLTALPDSPSASTTIGKESVL